MDKVLSQELREGHCLITPGVTVSSKVGVFVTGGGLKTSMQALSSMELLLHAHEKGIFL